MSENTQETNFGWLERDIFRYLQDCVKRKDPSASAEISIVGNTIEVRVGTLIEGISPHEALRIYIKGGGDKW